MYEQANNTNIIMLLNTAVYPFTVALISSLIMSRLSRKATFLGSFVGFIVGLSLVHPGLSFPPRQAIDYYSVSVVIAIITFWCLTLTKPLSIINAGAFLLLSSVFYLLLNPVLKHSSLVLSLSWAAICGLTVLFYYLILQKTRDIEVTPTKLQRRLSSYLPFIGLIMVSAGAAPVVSIGGSLLIGQLMGVFSAALSGLVVIGYLTYNLESSKGKAAQSAVLLLILGGLITQSHVLADIPIFVMLMFVANVFVTPTVMALSRKIKYVLISQVLFTVATSGMSLWLVWPAGSLY